jgi:hypothetical protein
MDMQMLEDKDSFHQALNGMDDRTPSVRRSDLVRSPARTFVRFAIDRQFTTLLPSSSLFLLESSLSIASASSFAIALTYLSIDLSRFTTFLNVSKINTFIFFAYVYILHKQFIYLNAF